MQPSTLCGVFCLAATLSAQGPPAEPQAQSHGIDWKDLTSTGIPIRFYGFLRLDVDYDTARMNSVSLPFTVDPENGVNAKQDDNEFTMDPRLTRFGMDVRPGEVGGMKVNGKLEIDFQNFVAGVPESRATPRMRLAWIDLMGDEFGLRVGQDWDVIAPLYPAAENESLLWNSGNIGDRRAQIQGRWVPEGSAFDVKASLGLTGAVSNEDLDTPPSNQDGFDSGMPQVQVRVGMKTDLLVEKQPASIGAWGAIGRTETDTAFGGQHRFDIWVAGIDAEVPLCETCRVRGEGWTGENLADFRGGVGQSINTATGREIGATGGWAAFVYHPSDKTELHVGYGTDDPDNADVPAGKPTRNLAGWVGTIVDWPCGLRTGFDTTYWETDWKGLGLGNTIRFNLYFQYNF